ncbi:serine/threonine-protein kinase, partial [Candidatus Protofrankia californiensis]|uniref:serine/threonine-protein kinase n=1 Tax=Candidatus Protofrankia californiensis TaxID=1839754 RepID=UPI0010412A34
MLVDRAQVVAALPAYELGIRLGAGAFGLVLQGRHRDLNRDVAIKVLDAAQESAPGGFKAEAQILAAMDHPHVVRVYDYVEADGLCLIVMELLAGGTLTSQRQGMTPEAACAVGLAVAEALTCAHAKNVLHRDIKPDNILFDAGSLVKVTDFGIAKSFAGSAATASGRAGTPKYMAPEQILVGRLGPSTDLYALGMLLYELLAGAPPFDPALPLPALYQHHLDTAPAPPASVPEPVSDVVLQALAKDPAARQPSAHAFALDLARAACRVYGSQWITRSGIRLRLDDDIREAADRPPQPADPRPVNPQPAGPPSTGSQPANPPTANPTSEPVRRTPAPAPRPLG